MTDQSHEGNPLPKEVVDRLRQGLIRTGVKGGIDLGKATRIADTIARLADEQVVEDSEGNWHVPPLPKRR